MTDGEKTAVASVPRMRYRAAELQPINCGSEVGVMLRLGLLSCALLFFSGCASDAGNGSWEGVSKDLQGDKMQIRGFSGRNTLQDRPVTN
jgi:hypothetical protein